MRKINRHNYEVFFIDYFDNELTKQETISLLEFLELHTDLKEEFESFENMTLESTKVVLEDKPSLKKHIDESNIEHYIIAALEHELTPEDQKEYTAFIAENSLYATTIERYKRTILPKESIIFSNKSDLKQKNKVLMLWPYVTAIAAVLLLFITLSNSNEPQHYHFQALQNTEYSKERVSDSLSDKLKTSLPDQVTEETSKEIARNSSSTTIIKEIQKKKNTTHDKATDTTLIAPKNRIGPQQKNNTPILTQQEIEHNNNNVILEENKAIAAHKTTQPTESTPTLKQAIHNTIKAKIFKDQKNDNQLIDKDYLAAETSKKLTKYKNISFDQSEKKGRKKTRLKIGKFELYRSKGV